MWYQTLILFLFLPAIFAGSVVNFLESTNFNVPINFKYGKIPCSKETVVFPETLLAPVNMESEISVSGLILPRDGALVLADTTIYFGADQKDVNCTYEGNIEYIGKVAATWSQPDIWSSPKFNAATPDAERVPCFDDTVEFPDNSQFSLTLPDKTQYVSGIKMNYAQPITTNSFKTLIVSQNKYFQQFVLNSYLDSGVRIEPQECFSRAGCSCQRNPLSINCELKYCSVPACTDPIKPIGHCCKICGGTVVFDIDESFDLIRFKELVEKSVESYRNSLVYHIGRLPANKIQLVIVEKGDYTGSSALVANTIYYRLERHWVQGAKYVGASGKPLNMGGETGKIFISMLVLVVLVMGGIYIYYYKLPEVSNVRFPILQRSAPGVFSRFETRTDSVVCLTRRDSDVPIGRAGVGTAFRNPLYDSTRQRAELEENLSVSEND